MMCEERGFRIRKLKSERVFFEELSVYCAEKGQPPGVEATVLHPKMLGESGKKGPFPLLGIVIPH